MQRAYGPLDRIARAADERSGQDGAVNTVDMS